MLCSQCAHCLSISFRLTSASPTSSHQPPPSLWFPWQLTRRRERRSWFKCIGDKSRPRWHRASELPVPAEPTGVLTVLIPRRLFYKHAAPTNKAAFSLKSGIKVTYESRNRRLLSVRVVPPRRCEIYTHGDIRGERLCLNKKIKSSAFDDYGCFYCERRKHKRREEEVHPERTLMVRTLTVLGGAEPLRWRSAAASLCRLIPSRGTRPPLESWVLLCTL